jgi:acyl-CoA synthetase (AMP-forming)/AMP-acid ligase II
MPAGEYLVRSGVRAPEKEALVIGSGRYSYGELAADAAGLASFLTSNGVTDGERAVVFLDNCLESVVSIFGIFESGSVLVYAHSTTPKERLAFIIENSGARCVIAGAARLPLLRSVLAGISFSPLVIVAGEADLSGGEVRYATAIRTGIRSPLSSVSPDARAAIIYTSGSTGVPKGVTLTHRNVDFVVDTVADYLGNNPDDRILQFLPLSVGYGLLQLLVTFRSGGTLILEKGFGFPYEFIRRLKEERVTGFAALPTVYSILLRLKNLQDEDLSSLRYMTNAAAAMPFGFVPRLLQAFPHVRLYLMHGLTECLRTTFLPPEEAGSRPTSVGKGMKGVTMWIEDEHGTMLPAGEVGELVVTGPNLMEGYWGNPEATDAVIKPGRTPGERKLRTGDLFTTDAEGYFYFVGRKDTIIKSRGRKVSPNEIENVLYLHESIVEARVSGIPDPILGEAIRAEIVPVRGVTLTDLDVKSHCRHHLEDALIPQVIEFVQSLPKTTGGKISRVG